MAHRCANSPYRALASARVAPTRGDSRRAASARAWRRAAATSARADSGGDAEATARSRKEKAAPWALMGRSVHEHHVGLSREQEDELALGAVADEAGVSLESLRSNLERLERLCPPLAARRERGEVKPARLARLALDLDAVASSMMRLKVLLPNADVAEMCARKPALLGAEAVDRAEAVAAIVGSEYPARFVVPNVARDDENDENDENEIHHSINRAETSALLASVPDILLEPCDEAVRAIVTRAGALRFLLTNADVERLAGKCLVSVDERRGARRVARRPRRRPRTRAEPRAGRRAYQGTQTNDTTDPTDRRHDTREGKGNARRARERKRLVLVRALARRRLRRRDARAHAEGLRRRPPADGFPEHPRHGRARAVRGPARGVPDQGPGGRAADEPENRVPGAKPRGNSRATEPFSSRRRFSVFRRRPSFRE